MSPRPRLASDASIIEATARVIGKLGPARMTLSDVAKECGIAPATLMQRFGSKRGLLLALASQAVPMTRQPFQEARRKYRSPLRALLHVMSDCGGAIPTPEEMSNHIAFLQIDLTDPDFYRHALEQARTMQQEIRRSLNDASKAGELRRCNTAELARTVQVAYNGSLVTWAIYRQGSLGGWIRRNLQTLLAPLRIRSQ